MLLLQSHFRKMIRKKRSQSEFSNDPINWGIIGCSRVAKKYFLPAVKISRFAKLGAIGSSSQKKAERWAKQLGCMVFGSYEDVLKSEIDAVYISLPVGLHEKWVIKAAEAGKHVICEKSSTISYQSAKNMVDACKTNGVRILEGFSFRFHPQHEKVLEYIRTGALGEVSNFCGKFGYPYPDEEDIRWKKELGGGVLNDACCYPICASRIIFQSEPTGVMSHFEFDDLHRVDVSNSIFLKYKNKTAFVSAGFNRYFQSTYNVWGSKALLNLERAFAVPKDFVTHIHISSNETKETIKNPAVDQTLLMLEAFCAEIVGAHTTDFNFEDDLLAQARVMEAARISDREKKFVLMNEIQ